MPRPEIAAYFDDSVLPLIARKHPEVISELSIRVEGSVGLALDDELSDMEAMIFLPNDLWRRHGAELQLTLIHCLEPFSPRSRPHCECPGDPYSWPVFGHPEINVHPRSELLGGEAEQVFAGDRDVPWQEVTIEELHQMQHCRILRDARQFLSRLREATAESGYPEQLWSKRLIHELADLKGEPWDFEKALSRGRTLEAQMILGSMLPAIIRIVYLVNRRFHPWRKYLMHFFEDLTFGPRELVDEIRIIQSESDRREWASAIDRTLRILTERILEDGILPDNTLEYLFDAKNGRAWENPDWRVEADRNRKQAEDAGFDPLDGWIWGWWDR